MKNNDIHKRKIWGMFDVLSTIYIAIGITALITIIFFIGLVNDYSWYRKMARKNMEFRHRNKAVKGLLTDYRLKADKNIKLNRSIHLSNGRKVLLPK
ncbi:hypothetical protein GTQ40_14660 [Flavobacteriaceae bacterium R38]|nr:hypothetical protein [Flavobacteriaceae bacterium R38]